MTQVLSEASSMEIENRPLLEVIISVKCDIYFSYIQNRRIIQMVD